LAVHCVEDTFDEGARGAALLLDAAEPVDAIVALSDVLALGALRELNRRGLAAGTDVALTGFDDSPLASVVSPALTTLRQPIDLIANELIDILTSTAEAVGPTERLLQPELIVRGSSAPG
jgi:DNA-binding LacI/PurR family transcriptional regulator